MLCRRRAAPIDAYKATVGATRDYAARNNGAQPGDPAKAAAAIVQTVSATSMPLRLPLGADAIDGIREKVARVLADVDASEPLACATGFGPES